MVIEIDEMVINKKTIKRFIRWFFELETPRDRNGTFEPQIVKKHQTTISNEIEDKNPFYVWLGNELHQIFPLILKRYIKYLFQQQQ